MSIIDRDTPFSVPSFPRPFTGIRELGFDEGGRFIISAWTTEAVPPGEPRGTFFTSIPISPMDYRRKHPTQCAFARCHDGIALYDDYGVQHVISAPPDIVDALAAECVANEVRPRSSAVQPEPSRQTRRGRSKPEAFASAKKPNKRSVNARATPSTEDRGPRRSRDGGRR